MARSCRLDLTKQEALSGARRRLAHLRIILLSSIDSAFPRWWDLDIGISRTDRCRACNEELRRLYDAEEDCWVFKGVLRVNPAGQADELGRILVHRKCFQPGNLFAGDVTSPVPITPRPGGTDQQWVSVKSEGGVG